MAELDQKTFVVAVEGMGCTMSRPVNRIQGCMAPPIALLEILKERPFPRLEADCLWQLTGDGITVDEKLTLGGGKEAPLSLGFRGG